MAREYAMRMVVMVNIAFMGQGENLNEMQLQFNKLDSITLKYARQKITTTDRLPHGSSDTPTPDQLFF